MNMLYQNFSSRFITLLATCLTSSLLFGCASSGARVESISETTTEIPSTTVYFYPNKNQSEDQQQRDRYECYLWAVEKSGFDPGQEQLAPHQRIEVVSTTPPGSDVAVGAATGAVFGAILSGPHGGPEGMIFGLVAGSMFGVASEASKQDQVDKLQDQYDEIEKQKYSQLEKQADSYTRAMSACLEGRDYTVQ